MIQFESKGNFDMTESWLKKLAGRSLYSRLSKYGAEGVAALRSATPSESGLAAKSWGYEVEITSGGATITWTNSDIENGFPVAVMLQYGYGTGTGGYVAGKDYINPALKPIFDRIEKDVWKEVTQ